jgi:hypothetical protein
MPVDGLKVGKGAKILEKARKTNGRDDWAQACHGSTLKAASQNFQSLSPKHPDRHIFPPTIPTARPLPEAVTHTHTTPAVFTRLFLRLIHFFTTIAPSLKYQSPPASLRLSSTT